MDTQFKNEFEKEYISGDVGRLGGVLNLITTKPDAEIAAEIRADITTSLEAMCKRMDKAKADGFIVQFQLAADGLGRQFISNLIVAKTF